MPFIPFIFGVIVGGAIAYVAKDDPSKQIVKDSSDKVAGGIGALTGKVTSIFKKGEAAAEETIDEAASVAAK